MPLLSMTGYGSAAFEAGGARYACSARSVNRKGLDLTIRLPPELADCDPAIRTLLAELLVRGEVVVAVDREKGTAPVRVDVDEGAAVALWDAYRRIAVAVGATAEVPLSAVLSSPDVLRVVREDAVAGPERAQAALAGVRAAAADLLAMREREGAELTRDVVGRLDAIRAAVDRIRVEAPAANRALLDRAAQRARQVAAAASVEADPAALANAIAGLAEKADIAEELSRLDAHLGQAASVIDSPAPHGRRLDFLCQEMMREIGTLGAKAQSTAVSHLVVDVKADIDRIREQAANAL
ncbi:MAG: DUF1732 domain-containing protein [Deltaproteobacteria bacterium]|nr:DUF1732 domain-containing protein [Deltaproteobacteria bacterium]